MCVTLCTLARNVHIVQLPELAALEAAGLRTEAPEPIAASVPLPRSTVSSLSVSTTKHTPLFAPIASPASPSSTAASPTPAPVAAKTTAPVVVPKPAQPTKKEAQGAHLVCHVRCSCRHPHAL